MDGTGLARFLFVWGGFPTIARKEFHHALLFLSLALVVGSLGLVAATPSQAQTWGWRYQSAYPAYYYPSYYPGYSSYYPGYSYSSYYYPGAYSYPTVLLPNVLLPDLLRLPDLHGSVLWLAPWYGYYPSNYSSYYYGW